MKEVDRSSFFANPDVFGTFTKAPPAIQKRIMAQIAPFAVLKYVLSAIVVLFVSPIILLFLLKGIFQNEEVVYWAFGTSCVIFCLFSILTGIYLSKVKVPNIEEWKNKLGYLK